MSANQFAHMGLAHLAARRFAWTDPRGNDRDDMVQEAAMVIDRSSKPGRYDPARGAFSTYAMACAMRYLHARRNRKPRLKTVEMIPAAMEQHCTRADATEWGVICADVWEASMRYAKPRERVMLDCLFVRGMTLAAAAEEMGLTKQRVHQMRDRFVEKMRRLLTSGERDHYT